MAINFGLMQQLASDSQATLYYDFSDTQQFYISGTFSLEDDFTYEFSDEFGSPQFSGTYLVSPFTAFSFYAQAKTVAYNPFQLAIISPGFTGFSKYPATPAQVQ